MKPAIWIDGKDIVVVPPDRNAEYMREILGARQSKKQKLDNEWRLPPTALNVITLSEWFGEDFILTAPQPVVDLLKLEWGFPGFDAHPDLKAKAEDHPRWMDLYPFQRVAVEYVVCNPHRGCLLGLSPGLGKTPVTIVSMDVLEANKILVLAPVTLAKNWGREIERWSRYYRSWARATAAEKNPRTEITVTNFETVFYTLLRREDGKIYEPEDQLTILVNGVEKTTWVDAEGIEHPLGIAKNPRAAKKWIELGPKKQAQNSKKMVWTRERITQARPAYANIDWDLMVIDESILIKNRKTVKVDVVQQLAKYAHYVLLLSGSAIAKYRDDLYPQMQTIMPRGFSAYWRFAEFFCVVDKGHWGWNIASNRPDHDPQKYLKDLYLVMNQKDVLPDLPDYIYDPIEIDLHPEQSKAFKQMVEEWIVALEAEEGEEVLEGDEDLEATSRLAQQTRMLQITSNLANLTKGAGKPMPSISAKEDLLIDLIRQGDIEFPLLVWTWFVPTTESVDERIFREFKGDVRTTYVTGQMSSEDKDLGIEMYKGGEVDTLVMQLGVGKFGHTLTDTQTVYYHDRTFESDAYLQSLRRVKRIGLTHSPRLIVPRAQISADPLVELNLAGKMESISKVASHDLAELLKSLGGVAWAMEAPGDIDD